MGLVDNLIAQFQAQQERANAANEQRFQQGLDLFDRIIAQNQPGGTLEKATEATIGRAKTQSVAQGTQALVSSGLASTTQAAGLGKKFEEEIGVPARLQAADIAGQRLSGALRDKAGFIERREDIGPDFGTIASLAQSIGRGSIAQGTPTSLQRQAPFRPGQFQRVSREPQQIRTPRVFNPAGAAQEKRSRAAQSYALLTSQRQQAGNRARAAAGL